MPLFGAGSSPFDNDVEKITNEKNTTEDWGLIMDLCDRVTSAREGPKDCMRAIKKRLAHQDPHVVMQAITLLDACANNCGKPFRLEVASREFEHDYKKLLSKSHPKVQDRLKQMLKKWAEGDFKNDPQLSLIPSLYQALKRDGVDFSSEQRNGYDDWSYYEMRRQAAVRKRSRGGQVGRGLEQMVDQGRRIVPGGKKKKDKEERRKARELQRKQEMERYPRSRSHDSVYNGGSRGGAAAAAERGYGVYGEAEERPKARVSNNPNVVSSQQEEEDIAKAIQMSLQETPRARSSSASVHPTSSSSSSAQQPQLYPTSALPSSNGPVSISSAPSGGQGSNGFKEPMKARALYDFEAAEDNELTFKTGEIVIIIDNSDQNWWKGSNHRGEGLFPANFVTTDMDPEPEQKEEKRRRSVQFNDSVEVKSLDELSSQQQKQQREQQQAALGPVLIDEGKIDKVLSLLHDANPTSGETDPPELVPLESHVNEMGPMIDSELEYVDRRLAQLTRLSTELVDALNLYHQLMRDMPAMPAMMPPNYGMQAYQQPAYMMTPPAQPHQPLMHPGAYGSPGPMPPPQTSMAPPVSSYPSMSAVPQPGQVPSMGQPDMMQQMPQMAQPDPGMMQQGQMPGMGQPDSSMMPQQQQQQLPASASGAPPPPNMDPQYAAAAVYSSPPMSQPQTLSATAGTPGTPGGPPQQQQQAPPQQQQQQVSYQPTSVPPVGMPDQQNGYATYSSPHHQTQMAPM